MRCPNEGSMCNCTGVCLGRGELGFIATPTMADIHRLETKIDELTELVHTLERFIRENELKPRRDGNCPQCGHSSRPTSARTPCPCGCPGAWHHD